LIAVIAAGVGVFLIVAPLALYTFYPQASIGPSRVDPSKLPPAPRLQTNPFEDRAALHADEEQQLSSYGWSDRDTGIVRIPIDRAMELISERGIPGWDQAIPAPIVPPRVPR
jgi:hypothetical protein